MNNLPKILTVVVLLVFGVIIWQTCRHKPVNVAPTIVTKVDTVYKEVKGDTLYVPKVDTVEITKVLPPEYVADTNYGKLKVQYEDLAKRYLNANDYVDTAKIDSIGSVVIKDVIQENKIKSRNFSYNYKIPTITKTITITNQAPAKNQLYVGGSIDAYPPFIPSSVSANVLLKTRRDVIYGGKVGMDLAGHLNYGVGVYFKIKL